MRLLCTALCAALLASAAFAADEPYCSDPRFPDAPRCWIVLDGSDLANGQLPILYLDNASTMANARAAELVLRADRSTQNGNPARPQRKGLMASGDRVCVTDRYLAWFDYSLGDGIPFGPPYANDWSRSGTLAGLWTLDPATRDFRYLRQSPDGSGGRWAHNELIPGSASPDGGQYWWDQYGPPVEHTIVVPTTNDPDWTFYFFSYQNARKTSRSNWSVTVDGRRSAQGVHYATSALMVSWRGKVDAVDGEDERDIKNSIRASLEYVCRPDDVVMVWRFMPERDVITDNLYVAAWLAYAGDNDGTARCDPAPGEQWPSRTWGRPGYVRSSERLGEWSSPDRYRSIPAGGIAVVPIHEPPCDRRSNGEQHWDYYNTGTNTEPQFGLRAGSWLEVGEAPDLGPSGPGLRLMLMEEPSTGLGTEGDPRRIPWSDLNVWHENADSTIGMGIGNGFVPLTLRGGAWYESILSFRPLP